MVIDSSALLAILDDEPERPAFRSAIAADTVRLASAATVLEASLVTLSRIGEEGLSELHGLLATAEIESVPFGPDHLQLALDAFRRFGKGPIMSASSSLCFSLFTFAYAPFSDSRDGMLCKRSSISQTVSRSQA